MRQIVWDLVCYNKECTKYNVAEEHWIAADEALPCCPSCGEQMNKKFGVVPVHVSWSTWRI